MTGRLNKKLVDIIYIDLAKAFDTVCHNKLLFKLDKIGIRGNLLSWIAAYLTNRKKSVIVNGVVSEIADVVSGVPQGSVLGPLLFLIYINDLTYELPSGIKVKLFADDCKIYFVY